MKKIFALLFAATLFAACEPDTTIVNNYNYGASDAGAPQTQSIDAGVTVVVVNNTTINNYFGSIDGGSADTGTVSVPVDAVPAVDTTPLVRADAEAPDATPTVSADAQAAEAGNPSTDADSPCSVTVSGRIADGVAAKTAITDNGFGILWYGANDGSMSYFRAFDWNGKATSEVISLFNCRDIVGGKDEYLASFYDDRGMGREWSVYHLSKTGELSGKQVVDYDEDKNNYAGPRLSFDGQYFRLVVLNPGNNDWCTGGTGLTTGRISSDGTYIGETGVCIGATLSAVSVNSVADSGDGKPIIALGVWDTNGGDQTMQIFDIRQSLFYSLFPGDTSGRRAIKVMQSSKGPLLSWYLSRATNQYYLTSLTDGNIVTGSKMPSGFIPSLVDGDRAVGLIQDSLSGDRYFVTASIEGKQLAKAELPRQESLCSYTEGRNGRYVITDGSCFGSDSPVIDTTVVVCK